MKLASAEKYIRELFEKHIPCHVREKMELISVNKKDRSLDVKIHADKSRGVLYQNNNQLQGGYAAVFADANMWLALMLDRSLRKKIIRTAKIDIYWFKYVSADEDLTANARFIRSETKDDKTKFYSSAKIKNQKGETVAVIKATNQLIEE
ncbi:hypothetical protein A2W54_00545 [Candidatus Giovannonibacteria bacterium RIFCSPHIGHO2_02_43_13]|uniref:Thioesterase domain-containing protein n=1 Tax=Candidatus Giovannonibacteria bacterium RIFCSPHIGHO2_02_43_13 TaxID=1798330 RepID=A0A1F5WSL0_9BACT|nr:MAG: hypothetical protein UW28_C0020G0017 [Parcubacteria group bacterium GW2011_GWA2_44_13]OGF72500.1 MAG: hypothetical protein A3E06_03555 [Candidatus Giovannonibacteria bacterium RIFCSPHIGHO2_12_FULL_44_42]OGF78628.1 MAG: hypothetical protein A2W54_00545 [Candidatus Giovannonibacteria bacterium RIFCSPHIGHO2_02_43_13]OGF89810.1 MAG: hypothetical protein A3I94_01030 [Candidatus Giovannonibacteria bacterium RIFCSPLOWO2_02_FULL_43_54]OGF97150.1 MAG: hypothetical protein A3H08_03365 [Candidatus